jgi:hypothetical protein
LQKLTIGLCVAVWLAIAVYFGVGAWCGAKISEAYSQMPASATQPSEEVIWHGVTYSNKADLLEAIERDRFDVSFPWLGPTPDYLLPLVAALCFGCCGGVVLLLWGVVSDSTSKLHPVAGPLFSAGIGAMIYFLALLVPSGLFVTHGEMRVEGIAGISFLGGLFSENAFNWIRTAVLDKIFPEKAKVGHR